MKSALYIMIVLDWLVALLSWFLFFLYRKEMEPIQMPMGLILQDMRLYLGLSVIPLVWLCLWAFLGLYKEVYSKSRLQVLYITLAGTFIGAMGLLFTVMRDDFTFEVTGYLQSFMGAFVIHLVAFSLSRMLFLSFTKWQLSRGSVVFNAQLISDRLDRGPEVDAATYTRVIDRHEPADYTGINRQERIDRIMVSIDDRDTLNKILPRLLGQSQGKDILVHERSFDQLEHDYRGTPSLRDAYFRLRSHPLWPWQQHIKRGLDMALSGVGILLLSPLLIWLYYKVKSSSEGEAIFRQERLGRYGERFEILKFRSMYLDAEEDGPALATEGDDRCTPLGGWMRRWRLDELPQFFNVLRGDMSLVGPRPERPYYAAQLVKSNPRYALLWQVRPGITSWGQIKHGYASTIEEMLRRFRYDLLYIERMSILLDFRILYYTLIVLWQGKGR